MKIMSLITQPHVIPKDLCSSSEHKLRYFWLNLRLSDLHRHQRYYYDQCTEIIITSFIQQFFSPSYRLPPFWRVPQNIITVISIVHVQHIIVFFAHKNYSRSFVKLQLNPWCQMDYFTDLLATFLCVDRGNIVAIYGGSESSQIPLKNLNLCSEDEQRSYGFGTTWGRVINDSGPPEKCWTEEILVCKYIFDALPFWVWKSPIQKSLWLSRSMMLFSMNFCSPSFLMLTRDAPENRSANFLTLLFFAPVM